MSTGSKFMGKESLKWKVPPLQARRFSRISFLCIAFLCLGGLSAAQTGNANPTAAKPAPKKKKKKVVEKPPLPPLPSGPTGPLQAQIPLDAIPAVPPQVSYQNGQLTIVAANSTLSDILKAVHKQTGAEIEIPAANDRVVTRLGPGPAQEVMAELLNGSRFNYVVLGSPQDANALTQVVLVPKTGVESTPQQAENQPPQVVDVPPEMDDANNADATTAPDEGAADDNADQQQPQAAEAEQPPAGTPEQPGVKTPQQMLQEMQQRQLQLQQQQQQQQQGVQPNPYPVQQPPQQQ
jgi:hypothetical protein